MVRGKQKGNEFERVVSKKLSLWLTNREDSMWRTQNSGGRFTTRYKHHKETLNQEGDITSTSSETEFFSDLFYVECKCYKDIELWSIYSGKGLLINWCIEYLKRSEEINKILFLIVKQNHKPILLITLSKILKLKGSRKILKSRFYIDQREFLVFNFEDFLNLDSKEMKKWLK